MYDQVSYITLESLQTNPPELSFLGFLFGIGASIVGSLLSRPKAPTPAPTPKKAPKPQVIKKVKVKQKSNLKGLVSDAKANGFNPKTVLQNGGLQTYLTSQTPFLTTNPKYVDWQTKHEIDTQYHQQMYQYENSKRQWLGNMFSSIGSGVTGFVQHQQQSYQQTLQNRLIESQINTNYSGTSSFNPYVRQGAQSTWYHKDNGAPVSLDFPYDAAGRVSLPPVEMTSTNVFDLDNYDNTVPDAEVVEMAAGELFAELHGWSKTSRDFVRHFMGPKYGQYSTASRTVLYDLLDLDRVVRGPTIQKARALTQAGYPLNLSGGGGW